MPGGLSAQLMQIAPILLMVVLFYFMLIRPQQKALKAHQALIAGLKRGDTVVLSNGVIGKITRPAARSEGRSTASSKPRSATRSATDRRPAAASIASACVKPRACAHAQRVSARP